MQRIWVGLLVANVAVFSWASPSLAQPAPLRWPLDMQPALSSTFGETRASGFHAGIDLKTWGKTGYPVHAVADGWVERLRTSPWGYGRALYQRLDDGRIDVYAHLEGFFEPAAERVRAAQLASRRYTVNLWPKRGEIPVRRGQVIARTGQSGAGPPHLHLEVRDAHSVPVNPLLQGLGPVVDTTPPTLRRVLVVPIGPQSCVDGGVVPVSVALRYDAEDRTYGAVRPLHVWGRVGLAIDSHDRADAATNKMSALSHELRVDDESRLTARYRKVSYADNHQVALDRLRLAAEPGRVYSLLYRRPGNRLSFYDIVGGGDGTLAFGGDGLAAGPHPVEIRAADAAGNQSRARLTLQATAPVGIRWARLTSTKEATYLDADLSRAEGNTPTAVIARSADGQQWEDVLAQTLVVAGGPYTWALPGLRSRYWRLSVSNGEGPPERRVLMMAADDAAAGELALTIRVVARPRHALLEIETPRALRGAPTVEWVSSPDRDDIAVRRKGPRAYRAMVPLVAAGGPTRLKIAAVAAAGAADVQVLTLNPSPLEPGRASTLSFLDARVELRVESGSVYETTFPQAQRVAPTPSAGLRPTTLACELGPADTAFDEHAWLWLRVPDDEPLARAGVYAGDGKGRWVFIGAEREEHGRLVGARIRALGPFAVLVDDTPPEIGSLRTASGSEPGSRHTFSAQVADAGSGIGREEDVELELDGVRLISEYDPEGDTVVAQADEPLPPGDHRLVVTVRDMAGNEAVRAVDFVHR